MTLDMDDSRKPAIEYRCPPEFLRTGQIVNELLWLAGFPELSGASGQWARDRAAALRSELRQREAGIDARQ